MAVDILSSSLGSPGKFQMILYIMVCCNSFFVAWNHLGMAFMGAKTKHHCKLDNMTEINDFVPLIKKGSKSEWDGCHVFVNVSKKEKASCHNGWTYYLKGREETVISEWDLVCDDAYKASLATTIYFCGVMLGGLVFGTLSDKFGRRPVLLFCLYSPCLLGILLFFIRDYTAFVILRFFLGFVLQGLQAASYISVVEIFALKYRSKIGTIWVNFWALSVMLLALIAFVIQDWKYIQLFITLAVLLQIGLIWFLPESFRWLIAQKRFDRAKEVVTKIVKFNNLEFPQDIFDDIVDENNKAEKKQPVGKKLTIIDLFRYQVLRQRSAILAWIWFSSSVGYYGISLNVSSLAGNKYLNFFISGLLELLAYILTVFVTERFGRRKPLCTYLMLGALMNITAGVLSEKADSDALLNLTTAFAIIGRVGFAGAFSVLFIYTCELYPTEIRNVGLGACASWARFGGVIAPQILLLGKKSRKSVPFIVFGCFAFIASVVSLLLFETLKKKLADTIQEIEQEVKDDCVIVSLNEVQSGRKGESLLPKKQ